MQAGDLKKRVTFFAPLEGHRSATGGSEKGWREAFSVWAAIVYRLGGETIEQARMAGRRPAILTVRDSSLSQQICLKWQVEIGGQRFEVRELPKETKYPGYLDMLVEAKI